jgi:large subunit ribosomal protein L29
MKIQEIKKKSKADLMDLLVKKREETRSLRFRNSAGKVKNVKEISGVRKDIARILTILKEKE